MIRGAPRRRGHQGTTIYSADTVLARNQAHLAPARRLCYNGAYHTGLPSTMADSHVSVMNAKTLLFCTLAIANFFLYLGVNIWQAMLPNLPACQFSNLLDFMIH